MSSSDLLRRLLSEKAIAYHPMIARALGKGAGTAVFLNQLLYWWQESETSEAIYRTLEEWQAESGLSRREILTARHRLKQLHILEEFQGGYPSRISYRLDFERLESLLVDTPRLSSRVSRELQSARTDTPRLSSRVSRELSNKRIGRTRAAPAHAPLPSDPASEEAAAAAHARTHEGKTEIEAALRLAWVRLFGEEKSRAAAELIATKADELEGIPVGWVTDAVDEMQLSGGNTPNYLLAILRSWKEKGRTKPGRPLNFKTHSYYDEACKCGGDICIGGPQ